MSSFDEISRAIGALEAQNALILDAQRVHSTEATRIRDEIRSLGADLKVVKADVAAFKPAAKKVERWEQRAVGVGLFSGLVGGGVLAYIRGKLGL